MPELLAAIALVALGSIVQSVSGVGAGFLIVPLVAMIDISLVPGPMIFGSLSLSIIMAWRERGAIDRDNLPAVLTGIVAGSIVGGWVLSIVPPDRLGLVFGLVILFAVAVTVSGLTIPLNRLTGLVAGALSGAMGASTGIGAPMLAIVYQHATGSRIRATLAVLYTFASVVILIVLAAYGKFGRTELIAGFSLMPGFLLGYVAANRLRARVDKGASRPLVLAVAAIAAVALLGKSLLG